jgi:putative SOS response-associated peptidase YedK
MRGQVFRAVATSRDALWTNSTLASIWAPMQRVPEYFTALKGRRTADRLHRPAESALFYRMCGRYTAGKNQAQVTERLFPHRAECDLQPRYNIAPTQMAPIFLNQGEIILKAMRWGLIPFWAKDESVGSRMINARAESVREKPAFRNLFKHRRCLVLADSFYEWQQIPGRPRQQPLRLLLRSEDPFVFAGLWDVWQKPDGGVLESYTIVTCESNDLIRPFHQRMPVILPPEHYAPWLDPQNENTDQLRQWLLPYPANLMQLHPVGIHVNNPQFDAPICIQRL